MRGELGVRRTQEQIDERRFGVGARGNCPDGLIVSKPRFVVGESEGRGQRR